MTFIHNSHMVQAMQDPVENQRKWLEEILDRHGITATELARRSKLDPSTLTRFLAPDRRHGHTLSTRTVSKISNAVQQMGKSHLHLVSSENAGKQAVLLNAENVSDPGLGQAVEALISGKNGVEAWKLESNGLEDLRLYAGDVLVVDMNATPRSGDIVCVEQMNWPTGTSEMVFRLYEPPYLLSGSVTGRGRKPEVADEKSNIIRGVVMARLSPRTMLHHTPPA